MFSNAEPLNELNRENSSPSNTTDKDGTLKSTPENVALPITGEEFRFGNMVFTSKFDSGNLQRVEKVAKDQVSSDKVGYLDPVSDIEFNVWTRPDCAGTPYENGNRSWFYFGVRGYTPGKLMKINIMNMNKQGKLYSQGHSPIFRILPQKPNWERLKERCTFESAGTEFILTFHYRFPEYRGTAYFTFCYPWSYTESQQQMEALDKRFEAADENINHRSENEIYYHRELFCNSLDGLRVDLLTISSYHGIKEKREPIYDPQLFPTKDAPRCRNFGGKKVFILTSRVHPGESPASFVYNGFLDFILRRDDKRAIQLRKQYVFKMIPMLNPDGVVRGHYRTDSRGINLNRLYLHPVIDLYPTIYAAKSLIVFHHVNNCLKRKDYIPNMSVIFKELAYLKKSKSTLSDNCSESTGSADNNQTNSAGGSPATFSVDMELSQNAEECDTILRKPTTNSWSSASSSNNMSFSQAGEAQKNGTEHLNHPRLHLIPGDESGVAFYVDLHGHASKRGYFMYGNHFVDEERAIQNLLFPKLISMNSAHFDYGGCNFTEKNMYTKDKRDGHSKEGSGRVAIHKAIGIVHSYTLECNYNSGRLVNSLASSPDSRVTPPPVAGFPPKYTIAHFEEVGRAMAISAIDYTDTNPLSRIQFSELNSVYAVKDWIRKGLRGMKGISKFNRPSISINPKTMIRSNAQFYPIKSDPVFRARPSNQGANANDINNAKTGFSFGRTPRFNVGNDLTNCSTSQAGSTVVASTKSKDLAPVRDVHRRSFSLPSPTALLNTGVNKPFIKPAAKSLTEINQTRSYSLRLMHTMARQSHTHGHVQNKVMTSSKSADNMPQHFQRDNQADEVSAETESPARNSKLGILSAMEQGELIGSQTSNQLIKKTTNGLEKFKKMSKNTPSSTVAAIDPVRELGMAIEKTNLKIGKRKSSGKKSKIRYSGGKGNSRTAPRNGHLQGSNIKLTDRQREVEDDAVVGAAHLASEMDKFENELKSRMSSFQHPDSYWIEL